MGKKSKDKKTSKDKKDKIKKRKEKQLKSLENRNRNVDERRFETLNIIYQLRQNNLTSVYPAIRELLDKLNAYVETGLDIFVNIPFPEKNKRIKGKLAVHKSEEVVIVMKHEIFKQ